LINTPAFNYDQNNAAAWRQTATTMEYNPGVPALPPFNLDVAHETVQIKSTSVPFHENDMIAQTPDLYVTNAYNGAYVVHRFLGPDQPLQNSNNLPGSIIVPTTTMADWDGDTVYTPSVFTLEYENPADAWIIPSQAPINVLPLNQSNFNVTAGSGAVSAGTYSVAPWLWDCLALELDPDTSLDNISQSVQIYRGLDESATLQIKRILSIEAAPLESSPARPFVTPPMDFEPRALQLYYQISHRMASIHPADFNDFGSIVDHIARIARLVAAPVASIVSAFQPELAPVAGMIASGVSAGARGAQALVAAGRQRPKPKPKPKARKMVLKRR